MSDHSTESGVLERRLDEVKGRVHGLMLLLAGTVAARPVPRLLG